MAQTLLFSDDYSEQFDPKCYLNMFYQTVDGHTDEEGDDYFFLRNYHEFWSSLGSENLTLLEFGGGPCIHTLISACPHVKEIVFAEFTEANRKETEAWRNRDKSSHDWSPFFIHVVQTLEGKSEEEAEQREEELRSKISQVIPCDIRENNPIQLKEPTLFDVVGSSLCLEAVMESEAAYREAILKLSKLLRPGGHLVMAGVLGQSFYRVGDGKFYTFPLSKDLIHQALEEAGFREVKVTSSLPTDSKGTVSDFGGIFFVHGKLEL